MVLIGYMIKTIINRKNDFDNRPHNGMELEITFQ